MHIIIQVELDLGLGWRILSLEKAFGFEVCFVAPSEQSSITLKVFMRLLWIRFVQLDKNKPDLDYP